MHPFTREAATLDLSDETMSAIWTCRRDHAGSGAQAQLFLPRDGGRQLSGDKRSETRIA